MLAVGFNEPRYPRNSDGLAPSESMFLHRNKKNETFSTFFNDHSKSCRPTHQLDLFLHKPLNVASETARRQHWGPIINIPHVYFRPMFCTITCCRFSFCRHNKSRTRRLHPRDAVQGSWCSSLFSPPLQTADEFRRCRFGTWSRSRRTGQTRLLLTSLQNDSSVVPSYLRLVLLKWPLRNTHLHSCL